MAATGLGQALRENMRTLEKIAGALIIAMGVFFVLTPFITRLNQEWHPNSLMARAGAGGPLVAGAAFAVGWTPCIGPTLTAILAAAATKDSVGEGGVLLAIYSAGLAVPFLLSAVAFQRATRRLPLAARPLHGDHGRSAASPSSRWACSSSPASSPG